MHDLLLLAFAGAAAGLLAGLLGIGGGIVLVPLFVWAFARAELPAELLFRFAVATSMACVLFNSAASTLSHARCGNVDWRSVRRLAGFVSLGAIAGALVSKHLAMHWLGLALAAFQIWTASRLLGKRAGTSPRTPLPRPLAGTAIGTVASIVGVAGASLLVPYLVAAGVEPRRAVGSSCALGVPLAVSGLAGYLMAGGAPVAVPGAMGFLYLPALAVVVPVSALMTPVGARLAAGVPAPMLTRLFACMLYLVAARLAWSATLSG